MNEKVTKVINNKVAMIDKDIKDSNGEKDIKTR